ncbi:MAG: carboxypeptidase regulatory-like domain-containing protein [Thermoanaerobaculia bacterium]
MPPARATVCTVLLASFLIVSDVSAQVRKRPVRPAPATAASVEGRITDAVSNAGIRNASVSVQSKTATTSSDGSFAIVNLAAGSATLTVQRYGYATLTHALTIAAGTNRVALSVSPKPAAKVTLLGGKTHYLDYDTTEFRSLQPFGSYTMISEPLELCPNPRTPKIARNELKYLAGPGVAGQVPGCCPNATVTTVRLTTKEGKVFNASIKDCLYYSVHFGGTDIATGNDRVFALTEVREIEFP